MLLRNYDNINVAYKFMNANPEGTTQYVVATDTTDFADGHINIKSLDNVIYGIYARSDSNYSVYPLTVWGEDTIDTTSLSMGYSYFMLGDGTTPVTYDDYKLDKLIPKSIIAPLKSTIRTSSLAYDSSDNSFSRTFRQTFIAYSDITVKEIGVKHCTYASNSTSTNINPTLVYREILDQPVDVPQGATFVVNLTIKYFANTNKPAETQVDVAVE